MAFESSGLSFPIEKQILRERSDPENKEHKNKNRKQAAKRHHEPFVSHHHVIRIHFSLSFQLSRNTYSQYSFETSFSYYVFNLIPLVAVG